jgi:hypothetical protein
VQGRHVDIFTDHRTLERILKQRTLSSRQFNTLMDLNHFDYDIRYIPGAKNVIADRVSRRADHNTSQAALLVTEITDAGHVSEDLVQEDHVQDNHVQEDHVQEDHLQEDHVQEDHVQEDHVEEDHVQEDHVQEDHVQEDHVEEDHVQEDHVQEDHVQEDHVQEDHVQEDHVQEDHVQEDHVEEDHVQEDHVQEDHVQEDHVEEDHVQEDHVQEDHVQEDHVQEDHVQEDHVQEDHVQEDHVQEDHVQEDHVQEDHVQEDHVQEDHVQEDHVQEDHVQEDHVQEDHVQEDHVQEDHVQEDHVQEGHVQEGHVQEGHVPEDNEQEDYVIRDEAVEWLEEVWLAYRTDPFTAVISDLINAGATNGAMARALPISVQRELNVKHSEQRVQHARRQLHRFKFNADGILLFGGRLVVPEGRHLRLRLFEELHDSKMGGHFGQEKTYLQLSRRFYWPDMKASIRRYVKGCDLCLRTKARQHAPFGLLEALNIPRERWKQVGIDFITKLPTTPSGNNAIVTIIDHLTKRAHFIPTTEEDLSAEAFARLFWKKSVRRHGMPTKIVSDRDPRFVSTFWKQLMQILNTKLGIFMAYHPQTDGQSEKANDMGGIWLCVFAREPEQEWDRLLPIAEFAYNSTSQSSTGKTPFELDLL